MFQNNKLTVAKVLNVILILMAVFCLCYGLVNIAYANTQMNKPDVNIYITDNRQIVCEGSLFGNDLWYPGKTMDGVIRVNNSYGPIEIKGMKVDVLLNNVDIGYDKDLVHTSFMNNMVMTVKKGKLLVFSDILFENRSLSQLAENQIGPGTSGAGNGFDIQKDDFIDLNYSLHMNEASGEELQNMSADVDISLDFADAVEAE